SRPRWSTSWKRCGRAWSSWRTAGARAPRSAEVRPGPAAGVARRAVGPDVPPGRARGGLTVAGGGPPIPRTWHELWCPGRLPPMLARRAPAPFSSPAYRFEVKWDGYRCLAFADPVLGRTFLQSRHGHDLAPRFPELAGLHRLLPAAAVLDGEIVTLVAGRPSFAALQRRAGGVRATAGAA